MSTAANQLELPLNKEIDMTTAPTYEIKSSTNYKDFKFMGGNRPINKNHVKQLARHMTETGNLTDMFPVTVNDEMFVLDGQHRIKALQKLGWPVHYRIIPGGSLATVRAINGAQKNWSWLDFAHGWEKLGKSEYRWFLSLNDRYPSYGFRALMAFTQPTVMGHRHDGTQTVGFRLGDYKCEDHAKAENLLATYAELAEAAEFHSREFALAMLQIIRGGAYDHGRMLKKLQQRKSTLQEFNSMRDNLRQIEEVYNYDFPDNSRVRLF